MLHATQASEELEGVCRPHARISAGMPRVSRPEMVSDGSEQAEGLKDAPMSRDRTRRSIKARLGDLQTCLYRRLLPRRVMTDRL